MAVKGRDEFRRGMAFAVTEWIEAGILQGQSTTSLEDTTPEDAIGGCRLARLRLCELQETKILLEIVRRLQELVQTDGSSRRTKGSIGIDLLSGSWLNSGTEFCYYLSSISIY